MLSSEKKTIINVLFVYLLSTLLLVLSLSISYYYFQKNNALTTQKQDMVNDAKIIVKKIKTLHNNSYSNSRIYPRLKEFNSAIYDIDKKLIFSTLNNKNINLNKNFFQIENFSYLIYEIHTYYLGAKYIVIEKETISPLKGMMYNIGFISIFIIVILMITSIFLVKLILKPIRTNIQLLDTFIKDTTHELNTPVATILANIETLEDTNIEAKTLKKLNRIKIGAMTISSLYEDLVYLMLNHKVISNNTKLNISEIITNRIEYFDIILKSKKLILNFDIQNNNFIQADKTKIIKLIDNLISNAIKYTKVSSTINIILKDNTLSIQDEGKGLTQEQINKIFKRYSRFDIEEKGFGIGLNIVHAIANEYNISIDVNSKIGVGTCVTLKW